MIKTFTTLLLDQEVFSQLENHFECMGEVESDFRARDPHVTQWSTLGISTISVPYEGDSYAAAGTTMLVIEKRERILPGKVIRKAVDARVRHLEEAEGRKLSRRERSQIRDNEEANLLPQAFIRETQIPVYLMRAGGGPKNGGYLIIASSSARIVEDIIFLLRGAFDYVFGYVPLLREQLITPMLKAVLDNDELVEERFHAATSAKFKGADRVVTVKNVELQGSTIDKLREEGFRPMEMSLSFKEDSEFKVNSKGVISAFKLYGLASQLEGVDESDQAELFAASFLIYMRAIGDLIEELRVVMANLLTAEPAQEPVESDDAGEETTDPNHDMKRFWYNAEFDSLSVTDTAGDVESLLNGAHGSFWQEVNEDVYAEHLARMRADDPEEEEDDGEL